MAMRVQATGACSWMSHSFGGFITSWDMFEQLPEQRGSLGQEEDVQSEDQTPQYHQGKVDRGGLCQSSPCLCWCFPWRGHDTTSQSSSLAPHTTCRLLVALLLGAADTLKARYANWQARYWQEQASLAQPALLLHLGPTSRHLDQGFQYTPCTPHSLGTPHCI